MAATAGTVIGGAVNGAIIGSATGAISSAAQGEDAGEGALMGAAGGAVLGGASGAVGSAAGAIGEAGLEGAATEAGVAAGEAGSEAGGDALVQDSIVEGLNAGAPTATEAGAAPIEAGATTGGTPAEGSSGLGEPAPEGATAQYSESPQLSGEQELASYEADAAALNTSPGAAEGVRVPGQGLSVDDAFTWAGRANQVRGMVTPKEEPIPRSPIVAKQNRIQQPIALNGDSSNALRALLFGNTPKARLGVLGRAPFT